MRYSQTYIIILLLLQKGFVSCVACNSTGDWLVSGVTFTERVIDIVGTRLAVVWLHRVYITCPR